MKTFTMSKGILRYSFVAIGKQLYRYDIGTEVPWYLRTF